jgi:hypothetical protein
MSYFKNFQRLVYQFPDDIKRVITDLSIRPKFRDDILENANNFELYNVNDGDTPEIIAYEQYGDENMHWAILIANNVMSIYNDWVKDQAQFQEFLFQKYKTQTDSDGATVTLSRIGVTEFVQFVGTTGNDFSSYVTGTTVKTKPSHFEDTNKVYYSYDSIVNNGSGKDAFGNGISYPTVSPVSIETVEDRLNEEKRSIIIPTEEVIEKMRKEIKEYVNG